MQKWSLHIEWLTPPPLRYGIARLYAGPLPELNPKDGLPRGAFAWACVIRQNVSGIEVKAALSKPPEDAWRYLLNQAAQLTHRVSWEREEGDGVRRFEKPLAIGVDPHQRT